MPTGQAAIVIARARLTKSTADEFDNMIAVEGIAPRGELWNETYTLASEHLPPVQTGDSDEALKQRKERALRLWAQLQPELNAYAEQCRTSRYSGWSSASTSALRRHP